MSNNIDPSSKETSQVDNLTDNNNTTTRLVGGYPISPIIPGVSANRIGQTNTSTNSNQQFGSPTRSTQPNIDSNNDERSGTVLPPFLLPGLSSSFSSSAVGSPIINGVRPVPTLPGSESRNDQGNSVHTTILPLPIFRPVNTTADNSNGESGQSTSPSSGNEITSTSPTLQSVSSLFPQASQRNSGSGMILPITPINSRTGNNLTNPSSPMPFGNIRTRNDGQFMLNPTASDDGPSDSARNIFSCLESSFEITISDYKAFINLLTVYRALKGIDNVNLLFVIFPDSMYIDLIDNPTNVRIWIRSTLKYEWFFMSNVNNIPESGLGFYIPITFFKSLKTTTKGMVTISKSSNSEAISLSISNNINSTNPSAEFHNLMNVPLVVVKAPNYRSYIHICTITSSSFTAEFTQLSGPVLLYIFNGGIMMMQNTGTTNSIRFLGNVQREDTSIVPIPEDVKRNRDISVWYSGTIGVYRLTADIIDVLKKMGNMSSNNVIKIMFLSGKGLVFMSPVNYMGDCKITVKAVWSN